MIPELTREERIRYSRHIILPEVGMDGQVKLKAAKVLLIGAGGLGAPAGLYLAAAGVGTLGIVDFDTVDLSNLHRQVIHGTADIGRQKLDSAEETLRDINPNVNVVKHSTMLTRDNALEIISDYDYVVDGTDNFATRYLVNDACVLLKKVNVYGSILRFEGQSTVFCAPGGPCYRCLYPEPPPPGMVPSCAEGGVLGVLPGVIGLLQATETVKLILGIGESLVGRLVLYDALSMRFQELRIRSDPNCPICADHPTLTALDDYDLLCGLPKPSAPDAEITVQDLKQMRIRGDRFTLLDVREPDERAVDFIPDSLFIPLGQVAERLDELNSREKIVVYCRSGMRSARACETLQANGFGSVLNLKGGILAWQAD